MAIFEQHKLSAKDREFWTVLFLVVRDAMIEHGIESPWTQLSPLGSILLGGELDERPKDSVWWVREDGKRTRLALDFGRFKKDLRLAAQGHGVDDALKARNRTRWANALTVAAIAGSVIATVATAGGAAAVIGPTAAAILGTVGTSMGATSQALRSMVLASAEGLTLDELAQSLEDGGEFYLAQAADGAIQPGEIIPYTPPERPTPTPSPGRRDVSRPGRPEGAVTAPKPEPPVATDEQPPTPPPSAPASNGSGLALGVVAVGLLTLTAGVVGAVALRS